MTDDVEENEKNKPKKKSSKISDNIVLSIFLHQLASKLLFSLLKSNIY